MLWALWRVHSAKGTGMLTIEWDKFKKQIVFKNGEPTATKSNWLQESFGQFLVKKKRIDMPTLHVELKAIEAEGKETPLGEWLMKRGLLQPQEIADLLEGHFRERVFNLLVLSRGQISFETALEDRMLSAENIRLTEPFLKLLWDAARVLYTEAWCRGQVAGLLSKEARLKDVFPLALSPQELRLWNDLTQKPKTVSACDETGLRLIAAAMEFDLVIWSASAEEKLVADLAATEAKLKKATLYEVLGVAAEAPVEDCKKAYLELVKKYHPDRLPVQNKPDLKQLSEKVFARINEAYATLTDSEKRKEYQANLEIEASGGMQKIQARLQAEMLLPQAKMALRRRHFQNALEAFKTIEAELKEDGEVIADRVYCEVMCLVETKGDLKAKMQAFKQDLQKALKIKPDYADAYYYRGILSKLDGDFGKALADFDRALELNPKLNEAASEVRVLRMRATKEKV